LRAAGLLASMGTIGDCYDNSMMESFWGTLQLELPFAAEDEAHDVPSFDPETFLPRENTRPISTPTS
jgi:transposase InsO family protein